MRPQVTGDQPGDAAIAVDLAYDAELVVDVLGGAEILIDTVFAAELDLEPLGDAAVTVELLDDSNFVIGGQMGYDIGDVVRVTGKAYNRPPTEGGVLTQPTGATFKTQDPNGNETALIWQTDGAVINDGTGLFHVDVPLTAAEDWTFRWDFTGAVAAAAETTIIVRRSKFLNP